LIAYYPIICIHVQYNRVLWTIISNGHISVIQLISSYFLSNKSNFCSKLWFLFYHLHYFVLSSIIWVVINMNYSIVSIILSFQSLIKFMLIFFSIFTHQCYT
jgi:hypothetical protein